MLEVRNLIKTYGTSFRAVDDLSITINDGEIFAFIGPNGAGKTTTIKSIMGLLSYDYGDILFNGINIKSNPLEFKRQVAYIPDNPDL